MAVEQKGRGAMGPQYEIDYYPAVTAEVFAGVDGQRELVDSFAEPQTAMEYCREGFTSSGEKVQWEVSRDQGATLYRSQEIPIYPALPRRKGRSCRRPEQPPLTRSQTGPTRRTPQVAVQSVRNPGSKAVPLADCLSPKPL